MIYFIRETNIELQIIIILQTSIDIITNFIYFSVNNFFTIRRHALIVTRLINKPVNTLENFV